jgi:hypothetical protein
MKNDVAINKYLTLRKFSKRKLSRSVGEMHYIHTSRQLLWLETTIIPQYEAGDL